MANEHEGFVQRDPFVHLFKEISKRSKKAQICPLLAPVNYKASAQQV